MYHLSHISSSYWATAVTSLLLSLSVSLSLCVSLSLSLSLSVSLSVCVCLSVFLSLSSKWSGLLRTSSPIGHDSLPCVAGYGGIPVRPPLSDPLGLPLSSPQVTLNTSVKVGDPTVVLVFSVAMTRLIVGILFSLQKRVDGNESCGIIIGKSSCPSSLRLYKSDSGSISIGYGGIPLAGEVKACVCVRVCVCGTLSDAAVGAG